MQAISHSALTAIARFALVPIFLGCLGAANASESVLCHATYGGETRTLKATPVSSSYAVEPMSLGSYFQLRVVFQKQPADVAGIKIYTYADREPSPVIIHQASYPYPPRTQGHNGQKGRGTPFGFTGQQIVYEPIRDGELEYWCEWRAAQ
jgi:hypothetical protein